MIEGWIAFGLLVCFFIAKECRLRWVMRRESRERMRRFLELMPRTGGRMVGDEWVPWDDSLRREP